MSSTSPHSKKSIRSAWFMLIVFSPILYYVPDFIAISQNKVGYDPLQTTASMWILVLVFNLIVALLDRSNFLSADRKDDARGLVLWAVVFVPMYVYFRAKRTGFGIWPFFAFVSCLIGSTIAIMAFSGEFSSACATTITNSMIVDLYPDIPQVNHQKTVEEILGVSEASYDVSADIRMCDVTIVDSSGEKVRLFVEISSSGSDTLYRVGLSENGGSLNFGQPID